MHPAHMAEPGPAVVETAAGDDQTALACSSYAPPATPSLPAEHSSHHPGARPRCLLDPHPHPHPRGVTSCRIHRARDRR
ncbi:DUF6207 family protein [Streptomyces sp. NPDC050534]|uniref:DUF6207 family protein n=1 Tax=Streptomyces sp. NPDC050534 TaxID=3365625 RepID=UPI0037947B8B